MKSRFPWVPWCYLAPNISGFLLFTAVPVVLAFALSLFRWDIFHTPVFVGLENFRNLLGFRWTDGTLQPCDPEFWQYLGNTLFLMLAIPVNMLVALLIAMLLNHTLRGMGLFRTLFYLPTICGGVGMFLLWGYIFAPETGLLNQLLALVGISGPGWLTNYHWAKPALMLMGLWGAMGGVNMLLYLWPPCREFRRNSTRLQRSTAPGDSANSSASRCRCWPRPTSSSS